MLFQDRRDAGRKLAAALSEFRGRNCVVLALPRGGVPVAAEVATALGAPLGILLVRKIGAPRQPELAIGSVVDGVPPIVVEDASLILETGTTPRQFGEIRRRELDEIERRRKFYLGDRPPERLEGRIAIVIDDGLATGNTMRAALRAVRQRKPEKIVMAVRVAPRAALNDFHEQADEIVWLETPDPFGSVGAFYRNFSQVSDAEVVRCLEEGRRRAARANPASITNE